MKWKNKGDAMASPERPTGGRSPPVPFWAVTLEPEGSSGGTERRIRLSAQGGPAHLRRQPPTLGQI